MATFLALAVLAVTLGLSFGERAKPLRWARVWGGPTEGPTPLSLRIELVETDPARRSAPNPDARIQLEDSSGRSMVSPLDFDAEGTAYATFPRQAEDHKVTILLGGDKLASGPIRLGRASYWKQKRSRGGWLRGKREGVLLISVGCREGVLALGHVGHLGITVSNAAGQPVKTDLTLLLEGLETTSRSATVTVRSDVRGRAAVQVLPKDLSASLRVVAGSTKLPHGSFFSSIPIESSAIVGSLRDGRVFVDSLIPIPKAYYSLVNDQGRWAAGAIDLTCDATAHCQGETPTHVTPTLPAWLMLGTEPALDGPNVIGWPITTAVDAFVEEAAIVREQLLLDGKSAAMAQAARHRATRFTRTLVGMGIAFVVLLLAIAVPLVRSRGNISKLSEQLSEDEGQSIIERRPVGTAAIVILVVLGLVALLVWAKIRISGG